VPFDFSAEAAQSTDALALGSLAQLRQRLHGRRRDGRSPTLTSPCVVKGPDIQT
jgi:hypothetical protein